MFRKSKKKLRISKRTQLRNHNDEKIFRDRKPGSFNQLWDWNTLEDIEIKGALKFG